MLGFVLKVECYKESRTPVPHASVLTMFSFFNCYQLIKSIQKPRDEAKREMLTGHKDGTSLPQIT